MKANGFIVVQFIYFLKQKSFLMFKKVWIDDFLIFFNIYHNIDLENLVDKAFGGGGATAPLAPL